MWVLYGYAYGYADGCADTSFKICRDAPDSHASSLRGSSEMEADAYTSVKFQDSEMSRRRAPEPVRVS